VTFQQGSSLLEDIEQVLLYVNHAFTFDGI
jgi:hypothetical protein